MTRDKPSLLSQFRKTMHDDILRLDRKIKSLQAEINAKIDDISQEKDELSLRHTKYLTLLATEIDQAIESIQHLVNLVSSEAAEADMFLKMNLDDLEDLHHVVKENTEKIAKLQEKI